MSVAKAHSEGGKRDAILDAALELFVERGFNGTAVPLVAEKAGVAAGTLYRYFESKEALVNALFQHWKTTLGRALMKDFPTSAPTRQQFKELWTRMSRFARENSRAFAFLELHHHRSYLDQQSCDVELALLGPIAGFVLEGQRRQVIKPIKPEIVIAIAYGAFVGLQRASWEGKLELTQEVLDTAEACVWEAVRV